MIYDSTACWMILFQQMPIKNARIFNFYSSLICFKFPQSWSHSAEQACIIANGMAPAIQIVELLF